MISFHATCHKAELVDGKDVTCDEVFEGAKDTARFTEHMTKFHGLSVARNSRVLSKAWLTAKPYTFKPPRCTGNLPPVGVRRNNYLAAKES
jgi:hypothetical protein